MQQAALNLPRQCPSIEVLFSKYEAAAAVKAQAYEQFAQWERIDAVDLAVGERAEADCDAAYDVVEAIADTILAAPARSMTDLVIKAQVLLARGTDPADLFHYRPDDLRRFVQEVRSISGL